MYNHKLLQTFINKVNKEAETAAQNVFDRYNEEFEKLVLSQMQKGNRLNIGMGMASLINSKGEQIADKFSDVLSGIQYLEQRAGFNTYEFNKH